jgi:hypothetical protein
VVVCGGYFPNFTFTDACFTLNPATNEWVEFASLPYRIGMAASALAKEEWMWINGKVVAVWIWITSKVM